MIDLKAKNTTILIVAAVIIATIAVFTVLFIGKKQGKFSSPESQLPKQEESASLTQEEIQEIMNRKVPEAERTPLSDEEIQEILNREVPEAERTPLSDEEIQEILNRNN